MYLAGKKMPMFEALSVSYETWSKDSRRAGGS
jgi:phosphoglycerate kinase